jgi:hypothetical protein
MFFREQIFVKAFFALSAQMSLPRMPQIMIIRFKKELPSELRGRLVVY